MRAASLLRLLTALAFATSLALGAAASFSFRAALNAKIDRTAEIERQAARPAAAARLATALLERRLALVSEPEAQAIASAFRRSDASAALADYRAVGGDPAIAAETEQTLTREKPAEQSEIALMRAIRGLRLEAAAAPRLSPPRLPPAASRASSLLLAAAAAASIASVLAYFSGHFRPRSV